MHTYRTHSSAETKELGRRAAALALRRKTRSFCVALRGPLGGGKTTFAQGFLAGLGVRARTASPTFILARRIPLRGKPFRSFVHMDAYRLSRAEDLRAGTFSEFFRERGTVSLVEWADRIRSAIPKGALWISFRHGKRPHERTIYSSLKLL